MGHLAIPFLCWASVKYAEAFMLLIEAYCEVNCEAVHCRIPERLYSCDLLYLNKI